MSVIGISGRIDIPQEVLDVARLGLFKKKEWRKVFIFVEREAMGQGGILEDNLRQPEVQAPLSKETLARKRRQGLPSTALVGKKGRIQKALAGPTSTYRKRQVIMRRKGGVTFRVYFNPGKFAMAGKKDPYTQVLQRGRMAGMTTKAGVKLTRGQAIQRARSRKLDDVASVQRMPGRPVMSYYPGNESKLTPALLKGVHQVLREKGLSE